jgi:hypothetical protein
MKSLLSFTVPESLLDRELSFLYKKMSINYSYLLITEQIHRSTSYGLNMAV